MKRIVALLSVVLLLGAATRAAAEEKAIADLPKDLWVLATVWTEPIKGVAREVRRLDPVSGFWFGLLEGSVKSVEHATHVLLGSPREANKQPQTSSDKPLVRYSF